MGRLGDTDDASQAGRGAADAAVDLEALYKEADSEVTRVNFNGDLLLLPSILVHSEYVFRQIVSAETYYSLSEEARAHLRQFLPPIKTIAEEQHTLECAFTTRTDLVHGNPIDKVQSKLKNGWFNPDRPSQQNQIRDNNKVLYDHYIRFYHMNLLNKLVKSRHVVLQHLMSTSSLCSPTRVPMDPETLKRRNNMERIRIRAAKRTKAMIADCRVKVGHSYVSSDEEEEEVTAPINKSLTLHTARSTLFTPNMKDLDLHQPTHMDDVKTMLKKFKKLRKEEPHAPSLDITGIDLDDVYERAGVLAQSEKIKQTMEALEKNLNK